MRLACNTLLFDGMSLENALAHIAWAGFQRVELSAGKNMGEHITPEFSSARIAEVRRLFADRSLEAVAMEAGGLDRQRLPRLLPIAAELGIAVVTVSSGGETGEEESFKRVVEDIGDLVRLAGSHGVRLAVKPHVGHAVFDTPTAIRLVAEVRESALGLNFDPSHLYRAGEEPVAMISGWRRHLIACHFRDCGSREQRVGVPETQIPGRGAINVLATLQALRDADFDGPLTLQIVGTRNYEPARAVAIGAEGLGYLHRCFQELGIAA